MYEPSYFKIEELVSPQAYKDRGNKAWQLLDDRLLITLDRLREKYGSMTINNWSYGGNREWSGLRTADSPYFSKYSQHSFGRAADIIFKNVTAEEVRQDMLESLDDEVYEYVNSIELGVSWVHLDCRNVERIFAFKP